ncbi:MAG TPA: hypothetical protein EYP76_02365 [Thiomicrorhabdus sp.]|nr:hypothetical protein [Thiomicrorhabdus sp.]
MTNEIRYKLMITVSIVLILYAIAWGLAPYTSFNISARFLLDLLDWPVDSMPNILDQNTKWLSAIGASLLAAFAILLGGIVAPAIREGNTHVAKVALWAIAVWFVIDGLGSIAVGIPSNVFFNTIYLIAMIAPLIGVTPKNEALEQS